MKRTAGAVALLAALGSGAAALGGPYMSQAWNNTNTGTVDGAQWGARTAASVPGLIGPWGQPVPVAAPYNASPPTGEAAARAMLAQSMPLELVQAANMGRGSCPGGFCPPPGVIPAGNLISPPGIPPVPGTGVPGMGMSSGGGPAPVTPYMPQALRPPGAVAAVGALTGPGVSPFGAQRTEVRFVGPAGMKISWFAPNAEGKPGFGSQFLEAPARYNFLQASIYRLKLSDIPHHPGVELYPTLEVVPAKAKTCTFLAHSAVPVSFTEEDFEQVAAGNFVVKVVYLPDPQFQDLAATGPDEVVSSRLEPGIDPIVEAQRRGCILLVVRLGNIDLEAPNTPAMDAPNPFCPPPAPHGPPAGPGLPAPPGLPPGLPGLPGGPATPYAPASRGPANGAPDQPFVPPGPGQLPPALPGSGPQLPQLPPGMPPGSPTGMLPGPGAVQQTQYQDPPTVKRRLPTLAELASQLTGSAPKNDGSK
jgi:hypothetical protein